MSKSKSEIFEIYSIKHILSLASVLDSRFFNGARIKTVYVACVAGVT